jgi:hypothetical protein
MSKHIPPVPPAGRSPRGPSGPERSPVDTDHPDRRADRNLAEAGRQGNINQNTTNQGFQQDR